MEKRGSHESRDEAAGTPCVANSEGWVGNSDFTFIKKKKTGNSTGEEVSLGWGASPVCTRSQAQYPAKQNTNLLNGCE